MKSVIRVYVLGRKKEWRWTMLDARNRRVIGASSESYKNRHAAVANLKRVTGVTLVPRIPYGTKSIEWLTARDKETGMVIGYTSETMRKQ